MYIANTVTGVRPATSPGWRRGRAFGSHAGDRGSIPGRNRPYSYTKTGSVNSTAKRSATNVHECHGFSEMTIIKGRPVSQ